MKSRWTLQKMAEAALLGFIGLVLVLPLTLSLIKGTVSLPTWLEHDWLWNRTLKGVQVKTEEVPLSLSTVSSAKYQESAASRFNENFAGKEALIRLTNELYFRAFNTTATKNSTLAVEKDGWLFEKAYLAEYHLMRYAKSELEPLVADIKKVQEELRKRGKAFTLVLTPSKASVMPETISSRWSRRYDERSRAYDQVLELLKQHGVNYIDGPSITRDIKSKKLPPFAKGGTHWTTRAALPTTEAIMNEFTNQGAKLTPISTIKKVTEDPFRVLNAPDADILQLMNLALPWQYTCGVGTVRPLTESRQEDAPKLAIIGGSFMHMSSSHFAQSHQFKNIDFFYYYHLIKFSINEGGTQIYESPGAPDFETEILPAECILLEVNEANLVPANHVYAFLADALKYFVGKNAVGR